MSTYFIYSKVNDSEHGTLYHKSVNGERADVSTNSCDMAVTFATALSKRHTDATYEVLQYADGLPERSVGTAIDGTFFPMIHSVLAGVK